jgi:hypothetical protein
MDFVAQMVFCYGMNQKRINQKNKNEAQKGKAN